MSSIFRTSLFTGVISCACAVFATFGQNSLTLKEALERTLTDNIQLQQFTYLQQQARANLRQATIRPQPELGLSVENVAGSGAYSSLDSAEIALTLGQTIELWGQRGDRMAAATAENRLEAAEYELTRMTVLALTGEKYYNTLRLQALTNLVESRIQQETAALLILETRAKAGAVSRLDVDQMAMHLAKSNEELNTLGEQHNVALHRLAALWQKAPDMQRVAGDILQPIKIPEARDMLNNLEQSPEMLSQMAQVKKAKADYQRLSSGSKANPKVSVGIKQLAATDDHAFTADISMPLNLNNPSAGQLDSASIRKIFTFEQKQRTFDQLTLELTTLRQETLHLNSQVKRLQNTLIPKARHLLEALKTALESGQVNVLQWSDAIDGLYALEKTAIEKSHAIYLNLLMIERLTGRPLIKEGNV